MQARSLLIGAATVAAYSPVWAAPRPLPQRPVPVRPPLAFEANQGQFDGRVLFAGRTGRSVLFLTRSEAVVALSGAKGDRSALRMRLVGAGAGSPVVGMQRLPGTMNYFHGKDRSRWRTHIPTYRQVKYTGVYPGTDLVYYGNPQRLEYDFIVAPGADPSRIQLAFEGARTMALSRSGDLVAHTASGDVRVRRPVAYQQVGAQRVAVACSFVSRPSSRAHRVSFRVARYDRSRPLVVDPVLEFAVRIGGARHEGDNRQQGPVGGVAVEANGAVWVAGASLSQDFPQTLQDMCGTDLDLFVTRLDPTGSTVLYSALIGGSGEDWASSIAVDGAGKVTLAGTTLSTDFPSTGQSYRSLGTDGSAFVTRIDPREYWPDYSALLGGSGNTRAHAMRLDGSGAVTLAGETTAANFPTTPGALQTTRRTGYGKPTGFVSRLTPNGSALVYSTFLGGSSSDRILGLDVDAAGAAVVTGETLSSDFPVTPGVLQISAQGGSDAFVTKLNSTGSGLVYGTYLGGAGADAGTGIALDKYGTPYVTGRTSSTNFPNSQFSRQKTLAGGTDAFVCKISSGATISYASYLGGGGYDAATAIHVTPTGLASVVGETYSADFPVTTDAYQQPHGKQAAFITRFNAKGSVLSRSTVFHGTGYMDWATCVAADNSSSLYVGGYTWSDDLPVTYRHGPCGYLDATLSKWQAATDTDVSLVAPQGLPGATVRLRATLQTGAFPMSAGYALRFVVDGLDIGSANTSSSGVATLDYTIPSAAHTGPSLAWAYYAGTPALVSTMQPEKYGYGSSAGLATLYVSRPCTLEVASLVSSPGSSTTLRAHLFGSSDYQAVSGATIHWKLDGVALSGSPTTTDAQGLSSLALAVPADLAQGSHTITCTFDGLRENMRATGTGTLTIATATSLVMPAVAGMQGTTVRLSATLKRTDTGAVLAGRKVRFQRAGVDLPGSPATTDAAGVATLNYAIAADAFWGAHTVEAYYDGEAGLAPCAASGSLTITQPKLAITLPVPPLAATCSYLRITATVTRELDRTPAANVPITFRVAGRDAGGFTTNSSGTGECWYLLPNGVTWGAELTANVSGAVRYEGAWANARLQIQPGTSALLTVTNASGRRNTTQVIRARLTETWQTSKGLVGMALLFTRPGLAPVTVVTDGSGYATYTFDIPQNTTGSSFPITVLYRGNADYSATTATSTVTVLP